MPTLTYSQAESLGYQDITNELILKLRSGSAQARNLSDEQIRERYASFLPYGARLYGKPGQYNIAVRGTHYGATGEVLYAVQETSPVRAASIEEYQKAEEQAQQRAEKEQQARQIKKRVTYGKPVSQHAEETYAKYSARESLYEKPKKRETPQEYKERRLDERAAVVLSDLTEKGLNKLNTTIENYNLRIEDRKQRFDNIEKLQNKWLQEGNYPKTRQEEIKSIVGEYEILKQEPKYSLRDIINVPKRTFETGLEGRKQFSEDINKIVSKYGDKIKLTELGQRTAEGLGFAGGFIGEGIFGTIDKFGGFTTRKMQEWTGTNKQLVYVKGTPEFEKLEANIGFFEKGPAGFLTKGIYAEPNIKPIYEKIKSDKFNAFTLKPSKYIINPELGQSEIGFISQLVVPVAASKGIKSFLKPTEIKLTKISKPRIDVFAINETEQVKYKVKFDLLEIETKNRLGQIKKITYEKPLPYYLEGISEVINKKEIPAELTKVKTEQITSWLEKEKSRLLEKYYSNKPVIKIEKGKLVYEFPEQITSITEKGLRTKGYSKETIKAINELNEKASQLEKQFKPRKITYFGELGKQKFSGIQYMKTTIFPEIDLIDINKLNEGLQKRTQNIIKSKKLAIGERTGKKTTITSFKEEFNPELEASYNVSTITDFIEGKEVIKSLKERRFGFEKNKITGSKMDFSYIAENNKIKGVVDITSISKELKKKTILPRTQFELTGESIERQSNIISRNFKLNKILEERKPIGLSKKMQELKTKFRLENIKADVEKLKKENKPVFERFEKQRVNREVKKINAELKKIKEETKIIPKQTEAKLTVLRNLEVILPEEEFDLVKDQGLTAIQLKAVSLFSGKLYRGIQKTSLIQSVKLMQKTSITEKITELQKLKERLLEKNKTMEKVKSIEKLGSMQKTSLLEQVKTAQKVSVQERIKEMEKLKTMEKINIIEPITPIPNIPPPPIPIPIIFKQSILKKQLFKPITKQSGYYALARQKGNLIKLNKQPLNKNQATGLLLDALDNTASASGRIQKTSNKIIENKPELEGTLNALRNKFYIGKKGITEKTSNRIDSMGEIQGITVKGWIARRNQALIKPFNSSNRKNYKLKSSYLGKMRGFNNGLRFRKKT